MCEKTTKEACLIDAVIPNSHKLHKTITKKLQKYTDLKEEHKNMTPENVLYNITGNDHTSY
jgi:hypothetical protein